MLRLFVLLKKSRESWSHGKLILWELISWHRVNETWDDLIKKWPKFSELKGLSVTRSIVTRSTLTRSTCHEINFHEINSIFLSQALPTFPYCKWWEVGWVGPGNKTICSHMISHDMVNSHTRIHRQDRTKRTDNDGHVPEDHCPKLITQLRCQQQPLAMGLMGRWCRYQGQHWRQTDRLPFKQKELPHRQVGVVHTKQLVVGWESPTVQIPLSNTP